MSKRLAIVAATEQEILPLNEFLKTSGSSISLNSYKVKELIIDIVYTGIGTLQTTYNLMNYLNKHQPDGWIQVGIGGALDLSLNIGDVFLIQSEMISGEGAEDQEGNLLNPFTLHWQNADQLPFNNGLLLCPYHTKHPNATGMTTFYAHGESVAIEKLKKQEHGQIENMEGAPFFYISLMKQIPFLSFRAISNQVEPRDKSKWEIPKAIRQLNEEVINLLEVSSFKMELLFKRSVD